MSAAILISPEPVTGTPDSRSKASRKCGITNPVKDEIEKLEKEQHAMCEMWKSNLIL